MPLASGIELPERYRVTRHIASGGMASVWEVEDQLLGRIVAVKVLGAQYAADRGARARFQREARTAARVSEHAHIATIYDTGRHGDDTFIVMEHFSGGTLADRLRSARDGGPPVQRATALRWLREAASALDAAHAAGIVHRDVKPANLLLDGQERLAVGDFGIARLADDTHMTQTGQVLGTAAYLSPEQALGRPATAASDRYALAVVGFELLTGARPFAGGPISAQARQHAEAQPDRASAAAPELPPAIDRVFARALAKSPHDRPATARALVDELERALRAPAVIEATQPIDTTRPMPPLAAVPAAAPVAPAGRRRAQPTGPYTSGGGRPREAAPAPPPAAPRTAAPDPGPERDVPRRGPTPLLPIGLAAAVALALVVVVIALSGGGDDGGDTRASTTTPAARSAGSSAAADAGSETADQADEAGTSEATPPPTAPDPDEDTSAGASASKTPSALNDEGYDLIKAGDYAAAIPLLRQSVEGYQAAGDTEVIGYGYALFNLATSLMQTGDPAAAIPLLQERLRFSNQRGTVQKALKDARAQASGGTAQPGKVKPAKPGAARDAD